MKPLAIGLLSLLIVGALSWLLLNREQPSKPPSSYVTTFEPPEISTEAWLVKENSSPVAEPNKVLKLRQRVSSLAVELDDVIADRSSAEAQLQRAERDVAALERFIEEIEERGEDPVDYAEEGLAMFQPAFDAYQDAFDTLELAESREQTATENLAAAESELSNILTD